MSDYVEWKRLEEVIVGNDAAQKDLAAKYPHEMVRWTILRERNGRFCPMARGVLKLIAYNERDNDVFKSNLENREWKTLN